jgi:hypothetical protein
MAFFAADAVDGAAASLVGDSAAVVTFTCERAGQIVRGPGVCVGGVRRGGLVGGSAEARVSTCTRHLRDRRITDALEPERALHGLGERRVERLQRVLVPEIAQIAGQHRERT